MSEFLAAAAAMGLPRLISAFLDVQKELRTSPPAEVNLQGLIDAYQHEDLVLVLGAGVSMAEPYGLPSWKALLHGLLLSTLQGDSPEAMRDSVAIAKFFDATFSPSPLIAARYVRRQLAISGAAKTFEERVREVLYANVGSDSDSQLMKEIRTMCIAPGKSPNLDSIISYNFDDVLERCVRAFPSLEAPVTEIFAIGQQPGRDHLPIYHVHGYLPREGDLTAEHRITLSEDIYHQQYSDTYNWSNIIQINKFREKTCLFIGSSLTDPNLRRLLDVANQQRGSEVVHHYQIRKRYDRADIANKIRALDDHPELDAARTASLLCDVMERYEEQDAHSFGIATLWIDRHEHAADMLHGVRLGDVQQVNARLLIRPSGRKRTRREPSPLTDTDTNVVRSNPRAEI